jgi:hypothetical protein
MTEERYQENLRQQAEDIFRSWGWVRQSDDTWGDPKLNNNHNKVAVKKNNRVRGKGCSSLTARRGGECGEQRRINE